MCDYFVSMLIICGLFDVDAFFNVYLWEALNDISPDVGLLNAKSRQLLSSLVLGGEEGSRVRECVHETTKPVRNVDLAEEEGVMDG